MTSVRHERRIECAQEGQTLHRHLALLQRDLQGALGPHQLRHHDALDLPVAPVSAAIGATPAPAAPAERVGITTADDLNFRIGPGVTNESTGSLPKRTKLSIIDRAKNGTTEWLKVRTPAGYVGWVSGKYVTII